MTDLTSAPLRRSVPPYSAPRPAAVALPADAAAEEAEVQRIAFGQCVAAMRRTLLTTPLGWGLAAWICWERGALAAMPGWLVLAGSGWLFGMVTMAVIQRRGADAVRHARWAAAVAAVDGLCWGALAPWMMGADVLFNAAIAAVLCGVAAVNAPVYIARIQFFYGHGAAMWTMILLTSLRTPVPSMAHVVTAGTALMLGLLCFYLSGIGRQVVQGIRLQLANAALAAQLKAALDVMARQATTDALTGLSNRRFLDDALAAQVALARRGGWSLAVLMLDLDHFKAVNDTRGHAMGDEVLRAFAQRLQAQLRCSDLCARYGGEEFVVVLSGTPEEPVHDVAERLRQAVRGAPLVDDITATVSVGAAAYRPGDDVALLLARADAALYEAKRAGRDRVVSDDSASAARHAARTATP